jgi:hypothetical protein
MPRMKLSPRVTTNPVPEPNGSLPPGLPRRLRVILRHRRMGTDPPDNPGRVPVAALQFMLTLGGHSARADWASRNQKDEYGDNGDGETTHR